MAEISSHSQQQCFAVCVVVQKQCEQILVTIRREMYGVNTSHLAVLRVQQKENKCILPVSDVSHPRGVHEGVGCLVGVPFQR